MLSLLEQAVKGKRQSIRINRDKSRFISVEEGKNAVFFHIADALLDHLAVSHNDESGDRHNTEFLGKLVFFVNVDLADDDIVALVCNLFNDRSDHTAGAAPGCPEIEKNGFVGICNFVEIVLPFFILFGTW